MVELVFMASGHKRRGASPIPDQEETNGMESLDNIKVLTRGESAIIAGVCSGIAEYYHLRKNSIRLAFLLTSLFFAIPVFAYVVLWLVLPKYPTTDAMVRDLKRKKRQRK